MLKKGKVLVLYGSRQMGKTSLINRLIKEHNRVFRGDGNDMTVNETLKFISSEVDIFANGGDRNNKEIPEAKVCKENNIKIIEYLIFLLLLLFLQSYQVLYHRNIYLDILLFADSVKKI